MTTSSCIGNIYEDNNNAYFEAICTISVFITYLFGACPSCWNWIACKSKTRCRCIFYDLIDGTFFWSMLSGVAVFMEKALHKYKGEFSMASRLVSMIVLGVFSSFEVITFMSLCSERFVSSKYISKGKVVPERFYEWSRKFVEVFVIVYCLLPMVGIFVVTIDFNCFFAAEHLTLPEDWRKYIVVAIFVLSSIAPVSIIGNLIIEIGAAVSLVEFLKYEYCYCGIFSLVGALFHERKFNDSMEHKEERLVTRTIIALACINLVSWAPVMMIRLWVALTQLIYGAGVFYLPSHIYLFMALAMRTVAPLLTFIVMHGLAHLLRNLRMAEDAPLVVNEINEKICGHFHG